MLQILAPSSALIALTGSTGVRHIHTRADQGYHSPWEKPFYVLFCRAVCSFVALQLHDMLWEWYCKLFSGACVVHASLLCSKPCCFPCKNAAFAPQKRGALPILFHCDLYTAHSLIKLHLIKTLCEYNLETP